MAKKKSGTPTKIADLVPDDKNFNKGSEFGNSLINKSISKFGLGRSILIDKNNRIIAGNKTVENAGAAGLEDVQVVESDGKRIIAVKRTDIDLDTPEGRELALADNATAKANIVFDAELIEAEVGEAVCEEWGIEASTELEAEEDDFDVPEGGIETDIVLGDLFEIGPHRLLCGDSTDSDQVARLMNGEKADMVFTDPPYGFNYTKKSDGTSIQNDGDEFVDVIRDAISLIQCDTYFICGDAKTARKFLIATEHLGEPKSTIVWVKPIQHRMHRFEPCHEFIWYWGDNGSPFYGSNVFEAKREINKTHPTIKPIELIEYCLKSVSEKLVVDLFLGSGSTMVASHQLKRKCYGMELDPKYCQVIVDRMRKLDPTLVIKRNGQPYEAK